MSTRAHVTIIDKDGTHFHMSHHCDGYPDGVGVDLVNILKEYVGQWTGGGIQEFIHAHDNTFKKTFTGVTWDQEYVYVIDCRNKTLSAYYKGITDPKDEDPLHDAEEENNKGIEEVDMSQYVIDDEGTLLISNPEE